MTHATPRASSEGAPDAETPDASPPAATSSAKSSLSLLGWLWLAVLTIPMGMVALGALVAAADERRVGVVIVGGQWLWWLTLLAAVAVTFVRLARFVARRIISR